MIEHLQLWRWEAQEAQRNAWDAAAEHANDLEWESRQDDEQQDNEGERNQ